MDPERAAAAITPRTRPSSPCISAAPSRTWTGSRRWPPHGSGADRRRGARARLGVGRPPRGQPGSGRIVQLPEFEGDDGGRRRHADHERRGVRRARVVHHGSGPQNRAAAGSIITCWAATTASPACRRRCCWRSSSGCRSRSAAARATRPAARGAGGRAGAGVSAVPRQQNANSWYLLLGRIDAPRMGRTRDEFHRALTAQGVPCTPFYPHPLYGNPLYQEGGCRVEPCPVAEACIGDAFWLPHRALLGDEETTREIAGAIRIVARPLAARGLVLRCSHHE
jgi:hypothetical protein